ncbi:MAG TPA: XdhC family protein [Acidimicrobiia bacterium]
MTAEGDTSPRSSREGEMLGLAAALQAGGVPFVLATVVWSHGPTSGKQASKALVHPDGTVEGWLGGACA